MSLKNIGPYDVDISIRERLLDRASASVRLHLPAQNGETYHVEMTPAFARKLARRLKKFADLAEPPRRRSS